MYSLGRLHIPDERDHNFLMASVLTPAPAIRKYQYWLPGVVLDQSSQPHCVGFSWKQWLQGSPVRTKTGPAAGSIYSEAQKIDDWPGENYEGTSVRAGAKVLEDLGHIAEYRWCYDIDTLRNWILTKGPVVLGTTWTADMFSVDKHGFVYPTGSVVGGHAYLCYGYSDRFKAFRCVNSWGSAWGQNGRFFIRENDVQQLLDDEGEACAAVEKKV